MSKQINTTTTRRSFIAKTGMITAGLTLGAFGINEVSRLMVNPEADADMLKKIADENNLSHGIPEVPYDHYIIFPEPKVIKQKRGVASLESFQLIDLALAPGTTSLLAEKLQEQYDFTFITGTEKRKLIISHLSHEGIQKILKSHSYTDILKEKKPDAYLIIITEKEILLAGENDRGIYYAVRSLLQIISHSTPAGEKPQIECMDVVDWPDQEIRAYFWMMNTWGSNKVALIKDFIYKTLVGSRYNMLVFMMRDGLQYKSHPKIVRPGAYTRDEFKEIVEFARMHYLEPVPAMQTPGHGSWILKKRPDLAELNGDVICTRNPETLKFVHEIADEMIELCGGKDKVRYFHVGHDEIRWRGRPGDNYPKFREECPRCKDTPYNQLLLEYIKKEHEFYSKRDIRMIMWSDMFSDLRNGKEYDTSSILSDMPKDIILSPWSAAGYSAIEDFRKKGFSVIKGATGYKVVSVSDQDVIGHMLANFDNNVWMMRYYSWDSSHNYYNNLSTYMYGNNAWTNDPTLTPKDNAELNNLKGTVAIRGEKKKLKFLLDFGNAMNYSYANKRFPAETAKFIAMDMSSVFNAGVKHCFGAGEMWDLSTFIPGDYTIAGIPMKLEDKVILPHSETGTNINIASKASSLIFLHTAFLAEKDLKPYIRRSNQPVEQTNRNPVAYYLIRYNDQTTVKAIMHFGFNVGNLRPSIGSRYPSDVRYVYTEKHSAIEWPENQDCRDTTPGAPALYQYEWVNPYPEKTIFEVIFVSLGTEVLPALSALTIREVK